MKKKLRITLIFIIIAVVGCILIFFIFNRNKKAISADEFIEVTSKLGYSTSRTNQTTPATIIEFWAAKKENYQINFYRAISRGEKKAKKIIMYDKFNDIKNEYENLKDSSSVEEFHTYNNYSKYILYTDEYYIVISRIDDTIMFAKAERKYENDIINVFDKLGY